MQCGRPLRTAQDVADLAMQILRMRFQVDTDDVQLQVTWDGKKELDLNASPDIHAVKRAHGGR